MNLTVLGALIAVTLLQMQKNGVDLLVESDRDVIDPGRDVELVVTMKTARGIEAEPPAFRDRVRGFSLAEEMEDESLAATGPDGSRTRVINWRLVPEPVAKRYRILPTVVGDFWTDVINFTPPPAREAVTGGMEISPKRDWPRLSWKLVGKCALFLVLGCGFLYGLFALVRLLARRVREHRMSPIERAWVELDRLLKRGLPGRGKYKDFYVELTMVVRRYVQRQHGVSAPHLTTEEFFEAAKRAPSFPQQTLVELMEFLNKADMIKFAGVSASPESSDDAVKSARAYIHKDDESVAKARTQSTKNGGEK